jgi:potassium-transporting ATPase ATP-binding subunit
MCAMPTHAKRLDIPGDLLSVELSLATRLREGDHVLCVSGDVVPCDGEVVDGIAVIDDPEGTARFVGSGALAVAGTRVLSDFLVIRIA